MRAPPPPAAGAGTGESPVPVPLNRWQRGLWFIHQANPDCGAYHLVFSLAVQGPSLAWGDGGWITVLLQSLLDEHPVLGLRLRASADGPIQERDAGARPRLRWVDLRGSDDAAVRERARQDARDPMNLGEAPLWRLNLYRTHADRWVAVAVVHHLLLDFWSLGLLLSQVAGWSGLAEVSPAPDGLGVLLPSSASQEPTDPALWAYWRDALAGAPSLHGLPTDRPRPARLSHEGASLPFLLDGEASDGVRRVARTRQATPFMVLLAAYAVWIHRLSGDTDIVIASPAAVRLRRPQARMLGQFVNTLPLRVRLQPEDRFAEVLARVRATVLDALRHQEAPFPGLVQRLAPRRHPAIDPLAQLGFSWERLPLMAEFSDFFLPEIGDGAAHREGRRIGDLRLSPFHVPQQEGQLDLLMEMGGERGGCMVGTLKYRTALYDAGTVSHWLQAWKALVADLATDPDRVVGDVAMGQGPEPCLPPGPRRDIPDGSLSTRFAAAARRWAEAPAVECGDERWTYAELMDRVQAIAGALRAMGVAPGAHVGLMLDRGVDLPAAILGIGWAGAAYVPMDPAHPRQRLLDIAGDAEMAAIVSQSAHRASWPEAVPALDLDALPAGAGRALTVAPRDGTTAYLIYTSGSTGRPKGVRVGHRSVLNFLTAMQARLSTGPDLRLMAVTTPAFDISVLELMLPMLSGGCVVVADAATLVDGQALSRSLDDRRISLMQATPATWKLLLEAGWPGRPGLVALCGGEALPQWLADALQPRCAALWNLYGPTETTVWSTAARLLPGDAVHLGEALDNTSLFILDAGGRPVPRGALGELWIAGEGLAIGYWRRPELTAERFTELASLPHAGRVYRTGDRVRVNGQGRLEHHGRLDFQVKLRGFRIELGEIEASLMRHTAVQDAAVTLSEDGGPAGARLVAHLVCRPDSAAPAPTASELRNFLALSLPSHMLPSAFAFMDALPQTPNGKVDRHALAAADRRGHAAAATVAKLPPRDALECRLAALFERLLGVADVGVHDDFFELGGHSLLAMQAVAHIRREFSVDLPVAELMRRGSVAALAARLRSGESGPPSLLVPLGAAGGALPLRAGPGAPQPLWLFHPIGGTVFCYVELSRRLAPGRPVSAIQSPGLAQAGEAEVTVEAMVARYLGELRAVQPQGPYLLGGWCFGGVVAFEAARQLREAGQAVDRVVLIDTRAPVAANMPGDGDDATLMSWFARDLAVPHGKRLDIPASSLRGLGHAAMFDLVLGGARELGVVAAETTAEQLARYFEAYLANGIALQTHLPAPQEVPVLLLRARDEPADHGPLLGWEALARGPLSVFDAPGDHNSVVQAPHAAGLAALIDRHAPGMPLPGNAATAAGPATAGSALP